MGKHSPVATTARYMSEFRCVGSTCPETCCAGWKVNVDKATFQRYRTVKVEPLASKLHENVHRSDDPSMGYALIRMRDDGFCPMLDEDHLCSVQRTLGHEALSRTCADYPRQYAKDDDALELRGALSCPEVARLALSSSEALQPVELKLDFANENLVPIGRRRRAQSQSKDPVERHGKLLGQVVQSVFGLQELSAVSAMVLVGTLLRRVAAITEQGDAADAVLGEAVEHYLAPASIEQVASLVGRLPMSKPVQLDLLLGTTRRRITTYAVLPSFKTLINEVWQGLHGPEGMEVAAQRLAEIDRTQFQAFERQHPHIFKNFIIHDIGFSLFPKGGRAELEREFMAIAVKFALIKLYVCGLMGLKGDAFTPDDAIRAVYVVSRNITHNQCFLPELLDTLAEHDALRLEVLATLIL